MQLVKSAEEINEIGFGFMASKALFSALHVGVFDGLADGPKDLETLAADIGVAQPRLVTLLTALAGIGLVEKDGDNYKNSPAAENYLVTSARDYFGDYLRYQIDQQMYPFMIHLDDVIQGERTKSRFEDYEAWMSDAEEARLFSESQHSGSLGPGYVLGKRVDLSGCETLLDVGGGSGAFSIMLCKRYPQLKAKVLDFPNVIEVGRKFVADEGLEDRIEFVPGNALDYDWPGEVDAVLMSYLLGGVPGEEVAKLSEHAFKTLKPGGVFMVHDFMVGDDRQGPAMAALWALQHLCYTPQAISLTQASVSEEMRRAGFADIAGGDLIAGMTKYVVGHKK